MSSAQILTSIAWSESNLKPYLVPFSLTLLFAAGGSRLRRWLLADDGCWACQDILQVPERASARHLPSDPPRQRVSSLGILFYIWACFFTYLFNHFLKHLLNRALRPCSILNSYSMCIQLIKTLVVCALITDKWLLFAISLIAISLIRLFVCPAWKRWPGNLRLLWWLGV